MRERAVPCRGATLRESIDGTHKTFNDSAICDRCVVLAARAKASREGWSGPLKPSSVTPPECSARVTERRTAGDAGTFGDGFLSGASPRGAALPSAPSRGTGPIEGRSAAPRPT